MIIRIGSFSDVTVSVTVIGVTPPPLITAVLVIVALVANGAYWLTSASYIIVALPPTGMFIPVIASGGPAVTAGAV